MSGLILLGCGKEKRPAPWCGPIVDLYTGSLYISRLAAARALGGPHLIVSAFHFARRPSYQVTPYDRTMADLCKEMRACYASAVASMVMKVADEIGTDTVVCLLSADYIAPWRERVENYGLTVETPLAGLGMGEQRGRCAEIVREVVNAA